jgi:hypothetical protein
MHKKLRKRGQNRMPSVEGDNLDGEGSCIRILNPNMNLIPANGTERRDPESEELDTRSGL